MEAKIDEMLYRLGANKAYIGFRYVVNCVKMIVEDEELQYYAKIPYTDTAAKYKTTAGCVERDIRTIVILIWEKGNRGLLNEVARRELKLRPKSKEFLAIMAEYMREVGE